VSIPGTTITFVPTRGLGDDELDIVEEHINKMYPKDVADKIIAGMYDSDANPVTILQVEMTVVVTIKET
jgi:hypothetical protein